MDFGTQQNTTFIPKQPLAPITPSAYRRHTISIATLVSVTVFAAAIILAGGVFAYKAYLGSALADKKASLQKASSAFEPSLIEELKRLDKRIEHSKAVLANHVALSSFFDLLQSATIQNVQFKSLNLTTIEDGKITISLNGIARSYGSVALQSDSFNKAKGLKNPVFSQLNLDPAGNVSFAINALLDPSVFTYSNLVSGGTDTTSPGTDASSTPSNNQ
jgi:hypothetical protein